MKFRTKRIFNFSVVATYLFLTGLENAIILPTVWQYLNYLGATQQYMLGFTVSGFSACAMISGLIGGRLSDAFPLYSKRIVTLAVVAMILGNIQYMIGKSVVNLIMGRIVCGIGACAGSALLAEIARTTSSRERTTILSLCNGLRQVGLLIGPAFQLILEYFDFSLFNGALVIRPFNAPGLFMAGLWIFFGLFTLAFYQNLDVEYKYELLRREHLGHDLSGRSVELSGSFSDDDDETKQLLPPSQAARRWYFIEESYQKQLPQQPITFATYIDEFLHDDTVVLFGMSMVIFFGQVCVETIIPPLMGNLFGYTSHQISLIYMGAGSFSIFIYVLVASTTRWTSDVCLLAFGWTMHILGFTWLLIWLPQTLSGETDKIPMLAVGILFVYMGFPVASVGTTSLLSKCVSLRIQGVAQGLRRLGTFSGLILGPIWGGATLHQPLLQMAIPLALLLLMAVLFGFSFKKIQKQERLALSTRK